MKLNDLARKFAEEVDLRIWRIISGKFKITKHGALDMRFKENKGKNDS